MPATEYETILVTREGRVATITLNRPKALNALNSQVMKEVTTAADFDRLVREDKDGSILLLVRSEQGSRFVVVSR